MLTIDEQIERLEDAARFLHGREGCADMEQIAEWLKELKELRKQKSRKITSKELLDKLDSVAWNCYERGNTFVGCMGCEYMKDKSCLLRLNGVPVDWVKEKVAKDESNNM